MTLESLRHFITRRLLTDGLDIFPVEPNIKVMDEFDIVKDEEAINNADIIVFLVAHDEFKGIRIFGKKVFDFCGVTNHN